MNAIGLLFNKFAGQNPLQNHSNPKETGKSGGAFQDILFSNGDLNKENIKLVPQELESLSSLIGTKTQGIDLTATELQDLLSSLLNTDTEITFEELESQPELLMVEGTLLNEVQPVLLPNNNTLEKFMELISNFKSIAEGLNTEQDIKKAAPKVLELLQQWTSLEKNSGSNKGLLTVLTQDGAKEQGMWRELLVNFQKRNQLVSNQQYNTNAKVTTSDVVKWLSNALEKHSHLEFATTQQAGPVNNISMPMSKIEQYVIYINQSNNSDSQPVDKQLIEQFQKVISASRFTSMPNGANQLSITLRPDNLGEMIVKLTQVNGEMTVKILVSSQAAKEMLESNINQLKNMFSPHQVAIEKQDVNVQQQGQNLQKDQGGQAFKEQSNNQSGESADQNKQTNQDTDFESTFQELIVNEGV